MTADRRLLTVSEVRDLLRIGETAVRSLVGRPGGIRAVRIGRQLRVRPDDLDAWLSQRVEGGHECAGTGRNPPIPAMGGQSRARRHTG